MNNTQNQTSPKVGKKNNWLVSVALYVVTVILIILFADSLVGILSAGQTSKVKSSPAYTTGTVTNAQVTINPGTRTVTYDCDVNYYYSVGNQRLKGEQSLVNYSKCPVQTGSNVKIIYDSKDPSVSFLADYMPVDSPLVTIILAIIIIVLIVISWKRRVNKGRTFSITQYQTPADTPQVQAISPSDQSDSELQPKQ